MRLDDRVDFVLATDHERTEHSSVPAYVYFQGVLDTSRQPSAVVYVEQLRVMLAPKSPYIHHRHAVRWRGDTYEADGPPIIHRQHGRDHHLTLQLKRETA